MSFKKTSEGRVFFQNSSAETANDEARAARSPARRLEPPAPGEGGPTQLQILALLRSLNEKLKATQVERNSMRAELDHYRRAIESLQSKPGNPNQTAQFMQETMKELEESRKLMMELEERQAGIEKDHKINSEKIRTGVGSYRDLMKRIEMSEQKQDETARKVEETMVQQAKVMRQIEKAIEDRVRFMRKIERIEETVIQTRDALNAKAMVLLTDQNIAGTIPADIENAFKTSPQTSSVPTAIAEEQMEQGGILNSRGFQMTAILLLLTGGIIAGWAVSTMQQSPVTDSGEFQITNNYTSSKVDNTTAAQNASEQDVEPVVEKWSISEDTSAFDTPLSKVAPSEKAPDPSDDIGTLDLNDTKQLEQMLENNPDKLASQLNAIEPGTSTDEMKIASLPIEETSVIDQDEPSVNMSAPLPLTPSAVKQGPQVDSIEPDSRLSENVKKIEAQAFEGIPEAQHDLAAIYTAGHAGVKQDFKRAIFWFEQSAGNGVANAAYNLGVLYHQGLGAKADIKKAIEWYTKAADLGHPEAQYNLGIAYIEGVGVPYDPFRADNYFQKAATQGIMEASYNLGLIYENGLLGKPQPDKALGWYKDAADKGSPEAKAALEQLAKTLGIGVDKINSIVDDAKKSGASSITPSPVAPARQGAANINQGIAVLVQIQEHLMDIGLYPGPADGADSPLSQDAIRAYQSMNGMEADGRSSQELLVHMLSDGSKKKSASAVRFN